MNKTADSIQIHLRSFKSILAMKGGSHPQTSKSAGTSGQPSRSKPDLGRGGETGEPRVAGKAIEPRVASSSSQSAAPQKISLDELRCELILELLEAILMKTVEDINSGLGGEVASSMDGSSRPLTIAHIESNQGLVDSRNAIASSCLTGVSCLALLENQQRVVLWSALIKILSYRLPIITPFQLHRLFSSESNIGSQSSTERHQSITMMKILMQVPAYHRRVLAHSRWFATSAVSAATSWRGMLLI